MSTKSSAMLRKTGYWAPVPVPPLVPPKEGAGVFAVFVSRLLQNISGLPYPYKFVDPDWDSTERRAVVDYLLRGRVSERYFGYSTCRFRCGIDDSKMGDADLTDGAWVWPEGLVHYVTAHHVRPEEDFVRHILSQK